MHFPKFLRQVKLVTLLVAAALGVIAFAGCGGGGGGGGSTGPSTVTVTGTLVASGTSQALGAGYIVTVAGTSLTGTTNSSGVFSIAGVGSSSAISLTVTDSTGNVVASGLSYNLSNISVTGSNTKSLGKVPVNVPPPPPAV